MRPRRRNAATRIARRIVRLGWAIIFFPVFIIYLVRELSIMVRDAVFGIARDESTPAAPGMVFRRPDAMASDSDRSVNDVVTTLRSWPRTKVRMGPREAFLLDGANDGISTLLGSRYHWGGLPHQYPNAFQPRLFTGAHGEQVAALEALHESEGPAVVIAHGLFTSKHFDYIRRMAIRMFYDWGFHVVLVDLRGHGQTLWTSGAPSSAGYFEGADVVEIGRELKADPRITSVGVLGYSLGGCTALNAARHASNADDNPIDGGVLAVSAPSDTAAGEQHVSSRPPLKDPFFPLWLIYWAGLRVAVRDRGLDRSLANWGDVARNQSVPYYGVTEEELYARSSAVNWANEITVPTLELHAEDDFVVPVEHAHRLRAAAEDNDNLHVWVVEQGAHCAFGSVDQLWYRSVVRRWFEYWATEPPHVRSVD